MTTPKTDSNYQLDELNFETTLGAYGDEIDAEIPLIDVSDFDLRRDEIRDQLWTAAIEVGFFQLKNHSIPQPKIDNAFECSQAFFQQPLNVKQQYPLKSKLNAGWEYKAQVRPSTGTADEKESYQISLPHMEGLWPEQTQPEFKPTLLDFEWQCWQLGMKVLSCFAEKLGFEHDFFTHAHDRTQADYQNTLRLLHYLPIKEGPALDENSWRAGAHTDFDCLTMVFQKEGQGGLQACAGKDARNGVLQWADVKPIAGVITCNIGDMLMRWSDDQLKSTLHRVCMPKPDEPKKSRYSLAYFCQANKSAIIQGPGKRYEPISAEDYLRLRIEANFSKNATK
jgi:isopenicillin N synthase-like dioxygenase